MRVNAIYKWLIALLVCGGLAALWYFRGEEKQSTQQLRFAKVTRGDFVSKVQATGTLEPQELVDVGAQVTGEIKEFGTDLAGKRVDYGSEVKAGQLLARIDDTIVELDIQRAEASVAQAKAQILSAEASIAQSTANHNKATRDLERARKLGVGDALSQMDFDQYVNAEETAAANLQSAKAQQATAQAQLQAAEAQLKSELRNRDYTHIKAPVDGTIVVRQVNVGQTVVSSMSASTLFLVARDLSKMQIWASVNEADIAKVYPGQAVQYTVDALPNENFRGVVNKIRPNATMSSNVVTYIVEIDIENPERKLLPYMSANANFIIKEVKNALLVPDAAFDFMPPVEMVSPEFRDKLARGPKGDGNPPPAPPAGAEMPEEGEAADMAARPDMPEMPEGARPALVWKKVAPNRVEPVRVLRADSDGSRSVVTVAEGDKLEADDELATGIAATQTAVAEKAAEGSNNLFGPKRMERRERGTGGVEAKPGQANPAKDRMGPPH